MRTANSPALLAAILAGCSTPSAEGAFADALRRAPAGATATVGWRDGEIALYQISLAEENIPAAARRTADQFIQPEGRSIFRGQEWGPAGSGFRFVKEYESPPGRRSVLVTRTGEVLDRSHEIPVADCPAAARATAAALGEIRRVEVVQRGDQEQLRIALTKDKARWSLVLDLDGNLLRSSRIVDARLRADGQL